MSHKPSAGGSEAAASLEEYVCVEEQLAAMTTERFDLKSYLDGQFNQSSEEKLSASSILSERILNLNVENQGLHAQVPRAFHRLMHVQVPLRAVSSSILETSRCQQLSACCCLHSLQH